MQNKRPLWRKLSTGVFSLLVAGSMLPEGLLPHAGAVSGSTPIRVALSINSSPVNNTFEYVSLTGKNGGLSVGFNSSAGFVTVYDYSSSTLPIRASLDSFYVIAGEYASWTDAVAAGQKLRSSGLSENIFIENRNGQKIYQVVQGYYATLAEAQAKETTIKGLGFQAKSAGSLRVSSGSYANYQAAQQQATAIRSKGYDAYVAARQTAAGTNSYEVWIGNEATAAARDSLKAQLAGKGIQAGNADTSGNYVLFKQDGMSDANTTVPHLMIATAGQELAVQGTGSPAIVNIGEKGSAGISYRGQMLLRGYNNRLAVINKLPLDDYLKGVVPKEMSTGWPLEALKAQAVAARNYAAIQPANKWGIAQVVDSTYDQAYGGYSLEHADTSQAVDDTRGQVIMYNNGTPSNTADDYMISALYSSTHGGRSADGSEVWGNVSPYLKSVDSHWDSISIKVQNEPDWHRVVFASGMIGYIRSDFVTKTGTKNKLGLEEATIKTDGANVRALPDTAADTGRVIGTARLGERVVILETRKEYNVSAWERLFTAADMQSRLGLSAPVTSLFVSKIGPSGRPLELTANGQAIAAPSGQGDSWRSKLGVLGTLFTVEQTGKYTVLGANGKTSEYPDARGQGLQVISGSKTVSQVNGGSDSFVVMNNSSQFRVATKEPNYILWGGGWGHGLGMSQWGAYGMAAEGYKYDQILTHYYTNVYLTPKQ